MIHLLLYKAPIPESVRNSPWLWVGLVAVIVGSLVYHNFFRKNNPASAPSQQVPARPGADSAISLLSYTEEGRSGQVHYHSPEARFSMYYELGGGNSVAGIFIPDAESWEKATSLPLARRNEILESIGRQVVLDKTGGRGSFKIEGRWLQIYH